MIEELGFNPALNCPGLMDGEHRPQMKRKTVNPDSWSSFVG